jgi:hypothetical protein
VVIIPIDLDEEIEEEMILVVSVGAVYARIQEMSTEVE